jgi:cytochrome c peroxidase
MHRPFYEVAKMALLYKLNDNHYHLIVWYLIKGGTMIHNRGVMLGMTIILASYAQQTMAETTTLNLAEKKKLTLEQQLGEKIFFDKNLSSPAGQACASCHDIKAAFSDPITNSPVSLGAVSKRTGTRNAPSAAYSAFAPQFHFDEQEGLYIGGQFLDGRAANLIEQAKGPFLNPDEMNNADENSVIEKIRKSDYVQLFEQVYGKDTLDDTAKAYDKVAQAIVAFENTASFNRFTSKYDYFLAGRVALSEQEQKGLELFEDENKGNCAACHISKTENGLPPLFTDFTYDNLGVPSNPKILALKGADFIDLGLGKTVGSATENGKFKVPSLRNVEKTAPYMHNGFFSDLKEAVNFYNTRDADRKWPAPEVAENVNADELGDLKLTDEEVDAIVAFLRTLTDGYQLQEKVTYSAQKGLIELPYVRLEGKNRLDKFYAAHLQQTSESNFEVTRLDEISINDFSLVESMPYYSYDNGLLEVPKVTNIDSLNATVFYTGQLKQLPDKNGKIMFELSYVKTLQ